MNTIEKGDCLVLPQDPEYTERRYKEHEVICRGILLRLPPEEQALFQEYRALLQLRQQQAVMRAYQSGLQVGEHRMQ